LELAKRFGATAAWCCDQLDPVAAVHEATAGRGVDVAIEAAWCDESLDQAAEMLVHGGRLVVAGIPLAISHFAGKKAQAQRLVADQKRAARRASSHTLPAVQRSRMATPVGVLGGIRGVAFFNVGGGWWDNSGYKFLSSKNEVYNPLLGYSFNPITGVPTPIFGAPQMVSGFRLVDGRASYGIGLETFALGFPIHLDWSWKTLFNKNWEDLRFADTGGSAAFRKSRFQFWIGYDF